MPSSQSSNSQPARLDRFYHPALVWVFRLLVGVTFVLSGFTKSVDVWGSFYKIGEYLEVWGWNIPSPLVVIAAFLLGGVEFVCGFLLLLGCYKRVSVWILLLMMAFMLPLTLYIAVADPVADCGCFGDFLIISNNATFVKNIFLTLFLLYLFRFNRKTDGLYVPYVQWVVGGLLSLYIMIVAFYGYNVQPMIDFRRFDPGTDLLASADVRDEGDEAEYEFIYEKDGSEESFSIDNLPDSTWTFVDRRLIGGSEAVTDGFAVISDGENIAEDIIDPDAEQFVVTVPDMSRVDLSYTYLLNELNDYITARGGSMVALVSADDEGIERWRDVSMASYEIYNAEPTLIKELARGHAAIVYLRKGVVVWKRTLSSISYKIVTETPPGEIDSELDPDSSSTLQGLTLIFAAVLIGIMILDRSGKLLAWLLKRRRRKAAKSNNAACDNDGSAVG
ncbi:MAG: DoxX family protein [Duncaniella sp.]|uniref:BT_3928 family protein n=1 Tax=Duncaniella sp. TaxID=2518496 RepID=UPI0023BC36BB|nr:BT_3928 family protein [Duncaniella sp.]MDE5988509.1 DoxX family protein [Duncaniella sp.]